MGKNKSINSPKASVKEQGEKKHSYEKLILIGITVLIIAAMSYFLSAGNDNDSSSNKTPSANTSTSNITAAIEIKKEEVSTTAKFYQYESDGIKMEVLALKAGDGTIRTAFNTCQVCYASGRGYYVQEGDELICQNCGNRFSADMVGISRGGCNPVPIPDESKADDGTTIKIDKNYLDKNKAYFSNWKTS
jgi:uncharacterized membrane protein